MAPAMTYVIPFFAVLTALHLIDTRTGLIIAYQAMGVPMAIWLMVPFFRQVPASLEEAARIDGASPFQVFQRISLPLVASGLVSTAILVFVLNWNEFMLALTLTNRVAVTSPVGITQFFAYEGIQWGDASAAGILTLLPIALFGVLVRRYLVQGMVAGATKG